MKDVDNYLPIDTSAGLSRCDNNENAYICVLKSFINESAARKEIIENFNTDADIEQYRIMVHGIKGTAGNIGAAGLSQYAYEHEMAAKDLNIRYIKDRKTELLDEFERVLAYLDKYLLEHDNSPSWDEGTQELSNEGLHSALNKAVRHMNNFEHDEAVAAVESLKKYKLTKKLADSLRTVEGLISMLDYDKAETIISDIRL